MKKLSKICIVSSGRYDYDLLKPIALRIKGLKRFHLTFIATGSHLLRNFKSEKFIKKDFKNYHKIKILYKDDSQFSINNTLSDTIRKFNIFFSKKKFDLIIILGDRFEILAVALVGFLFKIPIAHISGGEVTQGVIDDSIRHSITKLSNFHFVSNYKYFNRIKQLGENPKNIFNIGNTNVEKINFKDFLKKKDFEKKFQFKFQKENYLITFHPETLRKDFGLENFKIILKFFSNRINTGIIFTMPNIDTNNFKFINLIKSFVKKNSNSIFLKNLGKNNYFSLIREVDAVIGNSSSGITEVPSLKKPTINIGARQKGRLLASSIINIEQPNVRKLKEALKKIKQKKFKKKLDKTKNPYYKKNTVNNFVKILKKIIKKNNSEKIFFDIV